MFLFTPRVRTEGGTAKLASLASPGVTPKLPAKQQSERAKGPGGQCEDSGHIRDVRWAQAGPCTKQVLPGAEGYDLPLGSMAG